MDFFCQFADLTHPQISINRWEDHVLVPRNQNVVKQPQTKKWNRKHIIANKRKYNKPLLIQNMDNFLDENQLLPSVKAQDRQPSNLSRLKYKIEQIDKDQDRWEDASSKEVERVNMNYFKRKVKSGYLKAYAQNQNFETRSMERAKFYSKSIENNSHRSHQRARPYSSRPSSSRPTITLSHENKANTIHSKPRIKSHSYSKKSLGESVTQGIMINQLEAGKMRHILKCLSRRQ